MFWIGKKQDGNSDSLLYGEPQINNTVRNCLTINLSCNSLCCEERNRRHINKNDFFTSAIIGSGNDIFPEPCDCWSCGGSGCSSCR